MVPFGYLKHENFSYLNPGGPETIEACIFWGLVNLEKILYQNSFFPKISYFKNKKYPNNQDVKQSHTSVLALADSPPRRFPMSVTSDFSARQVTAASSGPQDIPYATKHAIPSNHTASCHMRKGLGTGTERKLILHTRNSGTLKKWPNRGNEAGCGPQAIPQQGTVCAGLSMETRRLLN